MTTINMIATIKAAPPRLQPMITASFVFGESIVSEMTEIILNKTLV